MEPKYGAFFSSSEDPQKLAASVSGFIKIIAGVAGFTGFSFIAGEINTFAEQAGAFVLMGYSVYGAAESLFGLGRKIVIAVVQKLRGI